MITAIVIPAYNEAERIASTLAELSTAGYSFLIVVDDGSRDKTDLHAKGFATVLKQVVNRGMGAALATGTRYALQQGAEVIVHFDADGQHDPADIKTIIEPITENRADVVLGSRYQSSSSRWVPWTKRYFLHAPGRMIQNVLTGIRLSDVHNGLRAMNRHAAESIIIHQDRMAHNTEIVAQIASLRLRYVEVPVTIRYQEYGQGIVSGIKILKDLLVQWLMR